jgi:magnesium protoporphyrin O-methyltransferase
MKSEGKKAQTYFDRVPKQWDALYSHENRLKYAVNKWLRKGMFERHRLTFEYCGDPAGAKVLDIGCGSGRYSIEFAKQGAHVVGIDFASSMIEFSRKMAQQMEVTDKCEFICDDFLTHEFEGAFDIVLALGVFDYIKDPGPMFKKIAQLRPRIFVASFPVYRPFWSIQRKIRYHWIRKCPIYDYSEEQLRRLYQDASFQNYRIVPCMRGLFGIAGFESISSKKS